MSFRVLMSTAGSLSRGVFGGRFCEVAMRGSISYRARRSWQTLPKSYRPTSSAAPMTKYILSYALMALFIGLGTYILCRPSRRFEGDR